MKLEHENKILCDIKSERGKGDIGGITYSGHNGANKPCAGCALGFYLGLHSTIPYDVLQMNM